MTTEMNSGWHHAGGGQRNDLERDQSVDHREDRDWRSDTNHWCEQSDTLGRNTTGHFNQRSDPLLRVNIQDIKWEGDENQWSELRRHGTGDFTESNMWQKDEEYGSQCPDHDQFQYGMNVGSRDAIQQPANSESWSRNTSQQPRHRDVWSKDWNWQHPQQNETCSRNASEDNEQSGLWPLDSNQQSQESDAWPRNSTWQPQQGIIKSPLRSRDQQYQQNNFGNDTNSRDATESTHQNSAWQKDPILQDQWNGVWPSLSPPSQQNNHGNVRPRINTPLFLKDIGWSRDTSSRSQQRNLWPTDSTLQSEQSNDLQRDFDCQSAQRNITDKYVNRRKTVVIDYVWPSSSNEDSTQSNAFQIDRPKPIVIDYQHRAKTDCVSQKSYEKEDSQTYTDISAGYTPSGHESSSAWSAVTSAHGVKPADEDFRFYDSGLSKSVAEDQELQGKTDSVSQRSSRKHDKVDPMECDQTYMDSSANCSRDLAESLPGRSEIKKKCDRTSPKDVRSTIKTDTCSSQLGSVEQSITDFSHLSKSKQYDHFFSDNPRKMTYDREFTEEYADDVESSESRRKNATALRDDYDDKRFRDKSSKCTADEQAPKSNSKSPTLDRISTDNSLSGKHNKTFPHDYKSGKDEQITEANSNLSRFGREFTENSAAVVESEPGKVEKIGESTKDTKSEKNITLSDARVCEKCHVTCSSWTTWVVHLNSLQHREQLEAENKQHDQDKINDILLSSKFYMMSKNKRETEEEQKHRESNKCEVCSKLFTSPETYNDHLKQLSHLSKVNEQKEQMRREPAGIVKKTAGMDVCENAWSVEGDIGMQLMQKMGWKKGEGLGKNKTGRKEPVQVNLKLDRKGLTSSGEFAKREKTLKHPVSKRNTSEEYETRRRDKEEKEKKESRITCALCNVKYKVREKEAHTNSRSHTRRYKMKMDLLGKEAFFKKYPDISVGKTGMQASCIRKGLESKSRQKVTKPKVETKLTRKVGLEIKENKDANAASRSSMLAMGKKLKAAWTVVDEINAVPKVKDKIRAYVLRQINQNPNLEITELKKIALDFLKPNAMQFEFYFGSIFRDVVIDAKDKRKVKDILKGHFDKTQNMSLESLAFYAKTYTALRKMSKEEKDKLLSLFDENLKKTKPLVDMVELQVALDMKTETYRILKGKTEKGVGTEQLMAQAENYFRQLKQMKENRNSEISKKTVEGNRRSRSPKDEPSSSVVDQEENLLIKGRCIDDIISKMQISDLKAEELRNILLNHIMHNPQLKPEKLNSLVTATLALLNMGDYIEESSSSLMTGQPDSHLTEDMHYMAPSLQQQSDEGCVEKPPGGSSVWSGDRTEEVGYEAELGSKDTEKSQGGSRSFSHLNVPFKNSSKERSVEVHEHMASYLAEDELVHFIQGVVKMLPAEPAEKDLIYQRIMLHVKQEGDMRFEDIGHLALRYMESVINERHLYSASAENEKEKPYQQDQNRTNSEGQKTEEKKITVDVEPNDISGIMESEEEMIRLIMEMSDVDDPEIAREALAFAEGSSQIFSTSHEARLATDTGLMSPLASTNLQESSEILVHQSMEASGVDDEDLTRRAVELANSSQLDLSQRNTGSYEDDNFMLFVKNFLSDEDILYHIQRECGIDDRSLIKHTIEKCFQKPRVRQMFENLDDFEDHLVEIILQELVNPDSVSYNTVKPLLRGHPDERRTPLERPQVIAKRNLNVLFSTPEQRSPLLKDHISFAKGVVSQEGFHYTTVDMDLGQKNRISAEKAFQNGEIVSEDVDLRTGVDEVLTSGSRNQAGRGGFHSCQDVNMRSENIKSHFESQMKSRDQDYRGKGQRFRGQFESNTNKRQGRSRSPVHRYHLGS